MLLVGGRQRWSAERKKIGSETKRDGSKQAGEQEGPLRQAGLLPSWHCLTHVAQAGLEQDGAGDVQSSRLTERVKRTCLAIFDHQVAIARGSAAPFASNDPPGPDPPSPRPHLPFAGHI